MNDSLALERRYRRLLAWSRRSTAASTQRT